ncbi:hypothetical protein KXD40_000873 [Peronospora effusa]|uniref:Protein kinase domain-containing protein n=1 Tax=Peronospora effusa TaxID=542832 RepID=A0A425C0I4_9STRA|nr:hypothetical protein DD237_003926 [Peronospora effusa]UIZ20602.1 hypothetical protein KXD40_000873 [Peronospora effusa]
MAPQSISEYTLLEFLGEGATAQVYLAKHEVSGAHVAIKVIDKLLIQRSQLESKIQQEMVLHAELNHPNVLHVENVFEDARNYYMILEYCARRSLSAIVKTLPARQMEEKMVKKIFRQVVTGVVYLHANDVIHRDLKLANLLINKDGEVKISDFGLAARLGEDHVTMCGTPNFIAPEVLTAENEPYNETVDIWSLGCILYCLLLGKAPFEGRKVSETLENVANAGQTPLKFPDGFSSSAGDLIKRMLSSNPRSRPSAKQILLHPWLRELSHKRATPPSCGTRKSLVQIPQHPRASSRSPKSLRENRRATIFRSMREEEQFLSSSTSSAPLKVERRRTLRDSHAGSMHCGLLDASANEMREVSHFQPMLSALRNTSSDSNCSPDDDSMNLDEDSIDLSEQSLPTRNGHDRRKDENTSPDRVDQSLLAVSRISGPVISVIMHLELQILTWCEISQASIGNVSDAKVQLQWSCKEPAEVGSPPTFELKVSNGWEGSYDLATGVLTAMTNDGDPLRYEIPGVRKARTGVNMTLSSSRRSPSQRPFLPPLVRFCQCLALRSMQLRQMALRDEVSKLPFVHYDTLPESLLASFHYRSTFLNQGARRGTQGDSYKAKREVDIAGIGRGQIDASGDLRVVYLDGAQLILAASGLQLRFRPSWTNDIDGKDSVQTEDVFELLTTGTMSSFLPSAVKQKLASIPEFIRRLQAAT